MTEYLTDEEQVERIKRWWSENGNSVLAGLIIGVGGLLGWRYWVDHNVTVAAEASIHFEQMVAALENSNNDDAIEHASIIADEYSNTVYGDLAHLSLAKAFVEGNEYTKAEQQLRLLLKSSKETTLQMIARKRLATILLQEQKFDEALQVVDVDFPPQFGAAFEELKGDILAAQGEKVDARAAYERAQIAQPPVPDPLFLQLKLQNLGTPAATS
jgi:predicted negative regulator of RcsB-dependent stress response